MATPRNVQSSCDFLLHSIRSSGLNYKCQETPFSIFLTLRKTLVKTKTPLHQNPIIDFVDQDMKQVKSEVNSCLKEAFNRLKNDYEDVVAECESRYQAVDELNKKNEILSEKLFSEEGLVKALEEKNKTLEETLEEYARDFEKETTRLKNISNKLNNELSETRKNHAADKNEIVATFKKEIKLLKKELGTEIKEKIKIEKKLSELTDLNANETKIVVNDHTIAHHSRDKPTAIKTNLTSSTCNTTNIICSTETNTSSSSSNATNKDSLDYALENIVDGFKEFLENFKDAAGYNRYEKSVKDLAESENNTLIVSISDLTGHNESLKENIAKHYTKVYPNLCATIKKIIKEKVDEEAKGKNFLIKLI